MGVTYFSLTVGQGHGREADLEPVRTLPRSTAWERKGMSLVIVVERSARSGAGGAASWRRGPEAAAAGVQQGL